MGGNTETLELTLEAGMTKSMIKTFNRCWDLPGQLKFEWGIFAVGAFAMIWYTGMVIAGAWRLWW